MLVRSLSNRALATAARPAAYGTDSGLSQACLSGFSVAGFIAARLDLANMLLGSSDIGQYQIVPKTDKTGGTTSPANSSVPPGRDSSLNEPLLRRPL